MEVERTDCFNKFLENTIKKLEILSTNSKKFINGKCKTDLKQLITELKEVLSDLDNTPIDNTSEEEKHSETQIQQSVDNFNVYDLILDKYEDFQYWLYFDVYQSFMLFYRTHHNLFICIISIIIILLSILFYILWFNNDVYNKL